MRSIGAFAQPAQPLCCMSLVQGFDGFIGVLARDFREPLTQMYLRGRDLDAFLLAGICNVGNCSALYVALPAQIVELSSAVHRTAVVPHDEVGYPPAMGVNEWPLRRVPDELINQRPTL